MDALTIFQGLGLAIAAGLVIGAVVPPVMPTWGAIAGAVPLGVIACAAALNGEDEPIWPALPVGVIGAGLGAVVARDIVAGAARREAGATAVPARAPAGLTAMFVLAAVLLAALSIFVPPIAVVALVSLGWLWFIRRRQAERKHEGLRVLR